MANEQRMAEAMLPVGVVAYLVVRKLPGGAREYANGMAGWTPSRRKAFRFDRPSDRFRGRLAPREWAQEHARVMGKEARVVRLVKKVRHD